MPDAVKDAAHLRKGDPVRVDWSQDGDEYQGPGLFVQHLKAGQRRGTFDWYIAQEPHCLVRLPNRGGECCFALRNVASAAA